MFTIAERFTDYKPSGGGGLSGKTYEILRTSNKLNSPYSYACYVK